MSIAEHPPSSPYQQGLDRNEANYAPLTPLSFLERTADIYPQRIAWIHGARKTSYADFRARCRRLAAALAGRGVRPGDTVDGDGAEHPGGARGDLRRAGGRRGAQRAQHPARGGQHRLHPRPQRNQGAADRHRVLAGHRGCARPLQGEAAGDRHRRRPVLRRPGARRAARRDHLRGAFGRRRCRLRAAVAGRRVAGDRAQLHLGHHGPAERRRLSPPRRLSERDRRHSRLEHGPAPDLSVDPADVPLQRLVLSLGDRVAGGDPGVPAPGRGGRDLRRDRRPPGDASVRRAGGDGHADQRHRRAATRFRPQGRDDDRGSTAAGRGAAEDGRARRPGHPRLWPDRGLRPGHGVRLAGGMGRAAGGRAGKAAGTPGRAATRCSRAWT